LEIPLYYFVYTEQQKSFRYRSMLNRYKPKKIKYRCNMENELKK